MGAFVPSAVNLVGLGEPLRLEGVAVTPELLPLLGASPLLGRPISQDDVKEGAPAVLLLSYGLWQSEFGGQGDAVGRSVRLGDVAATVIGVMPKTFRFPNAGTRYWAAAGFNLV